VLFPATPLRRRPPQAEKAHLQLDWTTGMVGFDSVLTSLKEVRAARAASPSDSDSGSEGDTPGSGPRSSGNDSDCESEGGRRKRRREGGGEGKEAKRKRKEERRRAKGEKKKAKKASKKAAKKAAKGTAKGGGGSGSGGGGEGGEKGGPSGSRVKVATHVGRYARRERAKAVKGYSASDLAAILGSAFSQQPAEVRAAPAGSSSGSGSESDGDGDGDGAAAAGPGSSDEAALRPGTPTKSGEGERSPAGDDGEGPEDARAGSGGSGGDAVAAANSWWSRTFVRSGRTGSSRGKGTGTKARGFSEQDQTDLYNKVGQGEAGGSATGLPVFLSNRPGCARPRGLAGGAAPAARLASLGVALR
jgi:Pin2-interacting protein X1